MDVSQQLLGNLEGKITEVVTVMGNKNTSPPKGAEVVEAQQAEGASLNGAAGKWLMFMFCKCNMFFGSGMAAPVGV